MTLNKLVTLGCLQILSNHFGDQFLEGGLRRPTEFIFRFRRITQERFDFRRTEITWINSDDAISLVIEAFFVNAYAFPANSEAKLFRETPNKLLISRKWAA